MVTALTAIMMADWVCTGFLLLHALAKANVGDGSGKEGDRYRGEQNILHEFHPGPLTTVLVCGRTTRSLPWSPCLDVC